MATEKEHININWEAVESKIGFPIHQDLKDFYSTPKQKKQGTVNFVEKDFFEETGNEKYDTWISFNHCEGNVQYQLYTIKSPQNAEKEIVHAFTEWTGGNDFGHRAMIGQFYFNIGGILILFNNDTGKIEWIDCEYGYFDVYEENPNGVLANNVQEFLRKMKI